MGVGSNIQLNNIYLILLMALSLPFLVGATIKGTAYSPDLEPMTDVLIEINTSTVQRYVAKDGTYLFSLPIGTYNISAYYFGPTYTYNAQEIITVSDNGRYLRDLFLKISLEPNEPVAVPIKISKLEIYRPYIIFGGGTLLGLAIIGIAYLMIIRSKPEERSKITSQLSTRDEDVDSDGERQAKQNIITKAQTEGATIEIRDTGTSVIDKTPTSLVTSDPINASETNPQLEQILELLRKNDGRVTQKDIRKEIPYSEAKISLMITELEEMGKIKKIKKGRGNIVILK